MISFDRNSLTSVYRPGSFQVSTSLKIICRPVSRQTDRFGECGIFRYFIPSRIREAIETRNAMLQFDKQEQSFLKISLPSDLILRSFLEVEQKE